MEGAPPGVDEYALNCMMGTESAGADRCGGGGGGDDGGAQGRGRESDGQRDRR